ncbi:hypothetical protein KBI23_14415 [bacterium]|nr:hypothetical protein [bacterium]
MSERMLRRPCSQNKHFVREVGNDLILETADGEEIGRRAKTQTGMVVRKTIGLGCTDEITETETPFCEMSVDDFVWSLTQNEDYVPI